MVGLVLISHCRDLACAAVRLARQVSSGTEIPIAAAGGVGDDRAVLGTDATDIMEAIESVYSDDGVLVLMDLGSAVLSAKTAVEFLNSEKADRICLCSAPLVEGAVAAAVQIAIGGSLEAVKEEAVTALAPKQLDLGAAPTEGSAGTGRAGDEADSYLSFRFTSRLKNGLHARPAAMLVNAAARYNAEVRVKNISGDKGPESARSINKLALLGILLGDEVEIRVSGDDAEEALAALQELAEGNFCEPPAAPKAVPPGGVKMLSLAPGIGMGRLYREDGIAARCPKRDLSDADAEIRRFEAAIARVKAELEGYEAHLVQTGRADEAGIFTAQKLILMDSDVIDGVKKAIDRERLDAAYIYQQTMDKLAADYRKLPGSYLPQRAADINDVASSVLAALTGGGGIEVENFDDIILAAKEILPSMIVRFENRIRGFLTETGGETSHVAILARTLQIPAISGYRLDENTANGTLIIVDGGNCQVTVDPDPQAEAGFKAKIAAWEEKKIQDLEDSKKEAVTTDGVKIHVRANVGEERDARAAVRYNAEGIGLLRTEFLFLSSPAAPDEDRQTAMLGGILAFFPNDPVTIRTLDIGGDKPIVWLDQPHEENPFLGIRGIRLCRRERDLFAVHLRAILRAAVGFNVKIMSPMISTVEEVSFCKEALKAAHESLEKEGRPHLWPVPFGIMVETPAAVMMADNLAKVVDFFSIGSNDLSQYVMAAERGNAALSKLANARQIAVLRSVNMTAAAARKAGIPVSVCGEMAGDPALSGILAGMGITELSMNPGAIGGVKRAITGISQKDAREKTRLCLECSVLDEVIDILERGGA